MSFDQNMQQYIQTENKIKEIYSQLITLRETKARLTYDLVQYAEKNDLLGKTIPFQKAKIRFVTSQVASTLSFKYGESCLGEIIPSKEQVTKIVEYLKKKRDIKRVHEIRLEKTS